MKQKISDFLSSYTSTQRLTYGALGVLIVIIAGFVLFENGEGDSSVRSVTPGSFVQEVSVSGKVVAAKRVDLVFSGSGRVSNAYVDVGDKVSQGKILAELENADVYANVLQKEASYEAAQAKLAALMAGTRSEEIAVSESTVLNAETSLIQARQAVIDEIGEAYTYVDDAIYHRVDQFITNPRSTDPSLDFLAVRSTQQAIETGRYSLEFLLEEWREELVRMSEEGEGGDVYEYVASAENKLTAVKDFLDIVANAVNALTPTANHPQTTIDGYRTDVATARSNINASVTSLRQAVTELRDAEGSLEKAKRNLTLLRAGATPEAIDEQEAQVKAARADLENARAHYRKTLVIAPFDGVITKMDAEVGGSASANESNISMIGTDTLHIESFVPEINVPLISVGDLAEVTLDAYGEQEKFSARVIFVDPAETIRDGVSTYRIKLQFINRDSRIRSGMTANISITTEEKENVITVPQGIIHNNEEGAYVWVREEGRDVMRTVTTGSISSLGEIEITSGLSSGDVVILRRDE